MEACRPDRAGSGAIPMLRYREAGRRDHKTGGGGDVIRVHAVATCTHDVHLANRHRLTKVICLHARRACAPSRVMSQGRAASTIALAHAPSTCRHQQQRSDTAKPDPHSVESIRQRQL